VSPVRYSGGAAAAPSGAPAQWGPNFGKAGGAQEITMAAHVQRLEYAMTSPVGATKDTWVGHPPACAAETNHNATGLQVDSLAALPKDAWVGFDLSGFPAGGTVTSAELTLRVSTAPVVATTCSLSRLGDANEAWVETTLQCSGSPAIGAVLQSAQGPIPAVGSDLVVTLNASWLARLSARLGVGNVSFIVASETALGAATFTDRETGGLATGPRLRLTLTVPT